jgi:death-on-curing protein
MNIIYLSFEEVIKIHDSMVGLYGGSLRIRDKGLIGSALARPQATFGGEDLYETIYNKAAALFHSLMFNHAFVDGNKRTTMTTTARFLSLNGYELDVSQREFVDFPIKVENDHLDIEDIATWLEKNSVKVEIP